jgi:hypothetical protein
MGAITASSDSRISRGVAPSFSAADVCPDLFDIGPKGRLHDDLKQLLRLAIEEALARVRRVDEGRVLLHPLEIRGCHDAMHLQRVTARPVRVGEQRLRLFLTHAVILHGADATSSSA